MLCLGGATTTESCAAVRAVGAAPSTPEDAWSVGKNKFFDVQSTIETIAPLVLIALPSSTKHLGYAHAPRLHGSNW